MCFYDLQDFIDNLRDNFGTTLEKIDFKKNPEPARQTINDWVEETTKDKIKVFQNVILSE